MAPRPARGSRASGRGTDASRERGAAAVLLTPRQIASELLPRAQARLVAARLRLGELSALLASDRQRGSTAAAGDSARPAQPGPVQPGMAHAGMAHEWAAAEQELASLGWCLGALASGLEADLLLARSEPRGLAWLLALVEAVISERGQRLEPPAARVELLPNAAGAWRLALRVTGEVLAAAQRAPPGSVIRVPSLDSAARSPRTSRTRTPVPYTPPV